MDWMGGVVWSILGLKVAMVGYGGEGVCNVYCCRWRLLWGEDGGKKKSARDRCMVTYVEETERGAVVNNGPGSFVALDKVWCRALSGSAKTLFEI